MKLKTPSRPRGTWLVDGHNVIYQVPELTRLQTGDNKQEARSGLIERCHRFAVHYDLKIAVVFDGTQVGPSVETVTRKNLQVVFSSPSSTADARIIAWAKLLIKDSKPVTVVTDDRGLRGELNKRVNTLGARAFWRTLSIREGREEKEPFSAPDIEAHFMAKESETLEKLREQERKQDRRRRKPR